MVNTSSTVDGTQDLSNSTLKTIESIKEIVRNHSDSDIYAVLKESNMDPNETTQKLLNQDPFHEVKRKREKKKENTTYKGSIQSRNQVDYRQGTRSHPFSERSTRGGFVRNALPEFRIVKDNRVQQNTNTETPASVQSAISANVQVTSHDSSKRPMWRSSDEKHLHAKNPDALKSSQSLRGSFHNSHVHAQDVNLNGTHRKGLLEKDQAKVPSSTSQLPGSKSDNSFPYSATLASNSSVVGLYSSSSDPVHVPSGSRSSGAVGAIKREVGVVGFRRNSGENSAKHSIPGPSSSLSSSVSGKDASSSTTVAKNVSLIRTTVPGSGVTGISVNRSLSNNHHGGKPHQVLTRHQKAPQPIMEWKPKSGKKSNSISLGFIETAAPPSSSPKENSTRSQFQVDHLAEKFSRVAVIANEHVIMPQHLRVPETERAQIIFGTFGREEFGAAKSSVSRFQGSAEQSSGNLSVSGRAPSVSSEDDVSKVYFLDEQVPSSGSDSPASAVISEHPSPDKKLFLSSGNSESYADIGLVRNDSPYAPAEQQKHQDSAGLPNFSAYNGQTGYDMHFFRPVMDEAVRSQGLPSPVEALNSHVTNSIPASTMAMVQQPVAQLYPQVHVPHFPNFMPYRQFHPQLYVSPMALPGYSSNPAYPHPSSGSNYFTVPGGSTHIPAVGLKYGASQYKPISAGTPTGFGTYTNQTGYAINGQGTVGGATGLEDPARMKYKEGDIYVQNQAETPEIWIQTPRELPGLQSAAYYNIAGQGQHAVAFLPHTGHTSFNAVPTAQPTHLQFPGLYHPSPQAAAIANPHHHIGTAMGSNVGVGVASAAPVGSQVGAYQQPQVGLNWNPNF